MLENRAHAQDVEDKKKGLLIVWWLTNEDTNPVKKHGIGKSLMTIQRLINLASANLPTCVDNDHGAYSQFLIFTSEKPPIQIEKEVNKTTTCHGLSSLLVF